MLRLFEFGELSLGLLAPMPGIFERGNLRVAFVSLRRFEEDGIIALGVKSGRPKINKIDRFIRNVLTVNIEVVAEIEFVHWIRCLSIRVQYTVLSAGLCEFMQ